MSSTKPPKTPSSPTPPSKNQFDEQDLLEARKAIQAIQPQPSFTRKQFIDALQEDCLNALIAKASTSQLTEVLKRHSVPLAASALVRLQRLAKKRSTSSGKPGGVSAA